MGVSHEGQGGPAKTDTAQGGNPKGRGDGLTAELGKATATAEQGSVRSAGLRDIARIPPVPRSSSTAVYSLFSLERTLFAVFLMSDMSSSSSSFVSGEKEKSKHGCAVDAAQICSPTPQRVGPGAGSTAPSWSDRRTAGSAASHSGEKMTAVHQSCSAHQVPQCGLTSLRPRHAGDMSAPGTARCSLARSPTDAEQQGLSPAEARLPLLCGQQHPQHQLINSHFMHTHYLWQKPDRLQCHWAREHPSPTSHILEMALGSTVAGLCNAALTLQRAGAQEVQTKTEASKFLPACIPSHPYVPTCRPRAQYQQLQAPAGSRALLSAWSPTVSPCCHQSLLPRTAKAF